MNDQKVEKLKDYKLPIKTKNSKNKERIYPFVEQIIDKFLNKKDPRE